MSAEELAVANPHERLARKHKAEQIADTLLRVMPSITADHAAQLDTNGRRAAADLARVKPASEETWALVVEELRRHERRVAS